MKIKISKQTAILIHCGLFVFALLACNAKKETKTDTSAAVESQDSISFSLAGRDSVSVFALLTETHQVDFVSSAMGVFVKAIDSIPNGTNVFWMYSVNDSMAQISSDKLITHTGDRIVWHFRKISASGN